MKNEEVKTIYSQAKPNQCEQGRPPVGDRRGQTSGIYISPDIRGRAMKTGLHDYRGSLLVWSIGVINFVVKVTAGCKIIFSAEITGGNIQQTYIIYIHIDNGKR